MPKPLSVSVVVTCYNYAHFLPYALDSVLHQTHPVNDVIVVDDGSTDQTSQVLDRYRTNPKIKVIYQDNRGQASAKNAGYRHAKGDIIAFIDADDIWEPTKIEKQLPLFADPKVGVVYTRQRCIDSENRPLASQPNRLPVFRGNVLASLLKDNFVPFSSVLVRRAAFEKFGLFDEKLAMAIDWDLWLRFSIDYHFDYVNEDLLLYRVNHAGQMSKDKNTRLHCADLIFSRFVDQWHDRLNEKDVRRARVYTYNSRGYAMRATNRREAISYYRKSLQMLPWQWTALKGLLLSYAQPRKN